MLSPKTVLVISDDLALYRLLSKVLSEQGYDVPYAQKTDHRLKMIIEKLLPDLIVIDPENSPVKGIELSLLVRQWSPSPILILTTVNSGCHEVRALNVEATGCLSEPFDASLVVTRVNNILSLSPAG